MDKINFSYASNVEHNFAQRLIIKTIERATGKKKLEKLYRQYSQKNNNPKDFWSDILEIMNITVINKSKNKIFIPNSGSLMIVANHPFGIIDGLILCSLVSKVRSEKYLKKLSSNKFKVFALRFATAAGMSNNLRLDLVFNDFVANSVLEKQIILLSNGQSWRPLIHVNDIAKSIFWALNYKLKRNFIAINIGSETWTFKIIDLAKKIAKIIPDTKIHINNADKFDKRSYRVNFNLFKKLAPKYQPTSNIKKSVIELAKFLKKEKKNLKNFRKLPKWSRLSRLNYLVKNNTIDKRLYLKND